MRKPILTLGASLLLAGCGSSGLFDRDRPDEFAVSRQAPLVIPPDFALEPPTPGAPRPQAVDSTSEVLRAMFGGPQERSATENALLRAAGEADPAIRSEVGDPETQTVDKGTYIRDIISAPEGDGRDAQAAIP